MSKEGGPISSNSNTLKNPNTLKTKVISTLAGIGLFCASLAGCGGSAEGKPAPVATATETSPSPIGAETTTPSVTPSATPRPTETPKPSPSPTAETASPSAETQPKLGSIEDYELLQNTLKEALEMPDERWNSLSRADQAKYISALLEEAYISYSTVFDLNTPPFEDIDLKEGVVVDVGKNPDPLALFRRSLMLLQGGLAITDGKTLKGDDGKDYYALNAKVANRVMEFLTGLDGFLSKKVERGIVAELTKLPKDFKLLGSNRYNRDGEDRISVDVGFEWTEGVSPGDFRVGGDTAEVYLLEARDWAGRPINVPIFTKDGLPMNLFLSYIAHEDPNWRPVRSS